MSILPGCAVVSMKVGVFGLYKIGNLRVLSVCESHFLLSNQ